MKNLIRLAALALLFGLTLPGCYYDKENELYPSLGNCDTSGVMTYSGSISPIMTANCNVCHSASVASGGVTTDNYDGLYIVAANGQLWSAVSHEGNIPPMPQGSAKLSDCNLTQIQKWIGAGAPKN